MNAACHSRSAGRGSSGFTLFELLVVMVIIGLMAAMVMPRMTASLPGVRLKSTARAVAASLRYARSRSVYESTPYIAVFDRERKRVAIEPVQTTLDATEAGDNRKALEMSERANVYALPEGIEFGLLNTAAGEDPEVFAIHFFPRGDSTGGKIVLENQRRRQTAITVDTITGSVEIDG